MNVPFFIARRYLFAKKSRNIINIISMISMVVVAFVTAAMITVMSAFNGIEDLVQRLFSNFDAQLTIQPVEGKTFSDSLLTSFDFSKMPEIKTYCYIIEEDAWLNYGDNNAVATIKGVSDNYNQLSPIDSMMYLGEFKLKEDSFNYAVLGLGVRSELQVPMNDIAPTPIVINAPIRGKKISRYREEAFNRESIMVSGVFSVNAELDMKYLFVPIDYARELFGMEHELSAVEIKLQPEANEKETIAKLQQTLPASLKIQTRYDKNALVYKTNASEKWATFLILLFILIIASFNIIASLTMLIIEKKNDIHILGSIGASKQSIDRIFIFEGVFINALGAVIGTALGVGVCLGQSHFGWVTMDGAMVDAYPVVIKWWDVLGIFVTVLLVGSLFSFGLVRSLMKRFAWNDSKLA